HLKRLILARGKKPYVVSVGRPTPAKLANFPDVGAFVLVACRENSLLLDQRDLLQPVVTPFELDAALARHSEWGAVAYATDLPAVVARVRDAADAAVARGRRRRPHGENGEGGDDDDDDDDDDEAQFSLATGALRRRERFAALATEPPSSADDAAGALALRQPPGELSTFVVTSAAADYLNTKRTFTGLDVNAEADVTLASEGRSGIASFYGEGAEGGL
ncbi:Diphthamide biosynthesis protein 2, partial [Cladochytrium tenue]